MRPKLYFCFPYHGVGGVSLLFLRAAEELASMGLAECYLVDYPNGFMARNCNRTLTQLVEYADDAEVRIPADSIAILQAITPWSIFPALRIAQQARLMFWNCHPFNLVPTLPGFRRVLQSDARIGKFVLATALRRYRTVMRRFVSLLLCKNALVFMDHTNLRTTEEYLGIQVPHPGMLAIGAPRAVQARVASHVRVENCLRLAWIGRLVDFKYYPLKNALRMVNELQPDLGLRIVCDIIGGGDYERRLRAEVADFPNLEIRFLGEMDMPVLERHLVTHTDVLFAMGTSALEGARHGIPTILLDLSYREVPSGYAYSWLHERDGFSLAEVACGGSPEEARSSLRQRLQSTIERPAEMSAAVLAYFERHHELGGIARRLLQLAEASRCTYGDLVSGSVVGRGFFYSAFDALRTGVKR